MTKAKAKASEEKLAEESYEKYYEQIADNLKDDRPKNAGRALSNFLSRADDIVSNYRPTGAVIFKASARKPTL
jgi:hypothetical protein